MATVAGMHPHFSAMDQFRCLQLLSYDPASMTVPDRGARAGASETLRGAARHVLEPVLKGDVHGFSMVFRVNIACFSIKFMW